MVIKELRHSDFNKPIRGTSYYYKYGWWDDYGNHHYPKPPLEYNLLDDLMIKKYGIVPEDVWPLDN